MNHKAKIREEMKITSGFGIGITEVYELDTTEDFENFCKISDYFNA